MQVETLLSIITADGLSVLLESNIKYVDYCFFQTQPMGVFSTKWIKVCLVKETLLEGTNLRACVSQK